MVYLADGDRAKVSALIEKADRAAARQLAVWKLVNHTRVLKCLRPFWLRGRRRLMRKEWTV
jgi:hypothetical protein